MRRLDHDSQDAIRRTDTLFTPEGMLKQFQMKYGTGGRDLLKAATDAGISISGDNDNYYADNWDFDATNKVIRIAETKGSRVFFSKRETTDSEAADYLKAALDKYFKKGFVARVANGAFNAFTAGDLDLIVVSESVCPEDRNAVGQELKISRAYLTLMANYGVSKSQEEITYLAVTYAGGVTIEGAIALLQETRALRSFELAGSFLKDSLSDATHQDIVKAFEKTPFDPDRHFITQLRSKRTTDLGIHTFEDLQNVIRKGQIVENTAYPGRKLLVSPGMSLGDFEAVGISFDPRTGRLITIEPLTLKQMGRALGS